MTLRSHLLPAAAVLLVATSALTPQAQAQHTPMKPAAPVQPAAIPDRASAYYHDAWPICMKSWP